MNYVFLHTEDMQKLGFQTPLDFQLVSLPEMIVGSYMILAVATGYRY